MGEGASLTKPASFGGCRHDHVYDEPRCLEGVHRDGPQRAWVRVNSQWIQQLSSTEIMGIISWLYNWDQHFQLAL